MIIVSRGLPCVLQQYYLRSEINCRIEFRGQNVIARYRNVDTLVVLPECTNRVGMYTHGNFILRVLEFQWGGLLRLFIPSTDPFIILHSRPLRPISSAPLIFRALRKIFSSPTRRRTSTFAIRSTHFILRILL